MRKLSYEQAYSTKTPIFRSNKRFFHFFCLQTYVFHSSDPSSPTHVLPPPPPPKQNFKQIRTEPNKIIHVFLSYMHFRLNKLVVEKI